MCIGMFQRVHDLLDENFYMDGKGVVENIGDDLKMMAHCDTNWGFEEPACTPLLPSARWLEPAAPSHLSRTPHSAILPNRPDRTP